MPQAKDSGQTSDEEVVLCIPKTKSAPEIGEATVPRRLSSESLIKGERRSILRQFKSYDGRCSFGRQATSNLQRQQKGADIPVLTPQSRVFQMDKLY